jgi:uncharacterized membrane protein
MTLVMTRGATPSRLLRWAFLVSLALNLFFIGASATHAVRSQIDSPGHFKPGLRLDAMVDTLPPADGAKLRAALDADLAKVTATHSAYRKAQDVARQALGAEPFDRVAFEAALADIRAKRQDLQQVVQAVVVKAAPDMSPEGRRRLGEWTAIKGAS